MLLLISFFICTSQLFCTNSARKAFFEQAQIFSAILNKIDQQIQTHCPTFSPRLKAILRNEILRELIGKGSLISEETIVPILKQLMMQDLEKIHEDRALTLLSHMSGHDEY